MINAQITTVTLQDGVVSELEFDQRNGCCCFFVKNDSEANAYASFSSTCTADADGTYMVAPGCSCGTGYGNNTLYLRGVGKVQVYCGNENVNPFKTGGKGVDAYTKAEADARYLQLDNITDCTKSEYEAMEEHDEDTYYFCSADPEPEPQLLSMPAPIGLTDTPTEGTEIDVEDEIEVQPTDNLQSREVLRNDL